MFPSISVLYSYCTSIKKTVSFLATVTVKNTWGDKNYKKVEELTPCCFFPKRPFHLISAFIIYLLSTYSMDYDVHN